MLTEKHVEGHEKVSTKDVNDFPYNEETLLEQRKWIIGLCWGTVLPDFKLQDLGQGMH